MLAEAAKIQANAAKMQAEAAIQQAANDSARIDVMQQLVNVLSQILPNYSTI